MERSWNGITTIHFYIREGYFGSALSECEKRLVESKEPNVAVLRGFVLVLIGKRAEGMRVLEGLVGGEAALGAMYALRYAHQKAVQADKEAIRLLEADIAKRTKEADADGLYSAAQILLLSGQAARAKPLIDKALEQKSEDAKIMCMSGWVELSLGRDQKSAQKLFEKSAGKNYADAYLGRIAILENRRATKDMRIVAKELSQANVRLVPGHIVSIRASIADREWEAAGQTIANALLVQEDCVYLLFLQAIHAVVYKGKEVGAVLKQLLTAFDVYERENDSLALSYASFFCRLSLKQMFVTQFCRQMMERAMKTNERKAEKDLLLFRMLVGSENEKEAMDKARALIQSDTSEPMALLSMVIAYLMVGRVKDASGQMAFVKEAHPKIATNPWYLFLDGVIARHSNAYEKLLSSCTTAINEQLTPLQAVPYGIDSIFSLDIDLLVGIVYQLFDFAPITPTKNADAVLREIDRVLTVINDNAPGVADVNYLLAKCKWLQKETEVADRLLTQLINGNEANADAFLLKAQMNIERGRIEDAESALDTGLAFNFAVRDSPLFHLIKANVLKKRNDHEAAVQILRQAIAAPSKEKANNLLVRREKDDAHRISLYLELIDSLQILKRTDEAAGLMNEAMKKWKGTPQEESLMIMNAQLLVAKGDVDGALKVLATVKPNQASYHAARTKMAEIYLEEKKDKRMFTVMFKELLEQHASPTTYALLGDAYMSVQNPRQAIEVYEKALKANPKESALAEKIGEAYVQCHLYTKAVNYYEAAVKSGREASMRMKLAHLLFRMGNYDKCERVLNDPLEKEQEQGPLDMRTMQQHVQYLLLLSKVHHEKGVFDKSSEDLVKAKSVQQKIIGKSEGAMLIQMKKDCAKICCQIAEMFMMKRDNAKAIEAYKEALQYNESDIKTNLALAQAYLSTNRLEQCYKQCERVTNIDKNNIEATLMTADIHYQKNKMDEAYAQFTNVLDQAPNNYHALSRCIELSWRRGDMEAAEHRLKKALESNARATDAGLNYCKGIHEWYSGELNFALQAFNRAKRDLEWGERSIYNIVDICLNPDNEIIGEITDDPNERVNTNTAERFLKELQFKHNGQDPKYQLHMTMIEMASGEKSKVQHALDVFLEQAFDRTDRVVSPGAVLGAARAHIALKQTPKAKQLLKRVANQAWNIEEADYLEKCWLLLAEIYVNQNKYEQAQLFIKKVTEHNASCIKAFELSGYIHEKDGKWMEAAVHYEDAWRFSRKRNPVIGYKLAYNYLKCKRLFDCIEVCQKVLTQYPTYPKIKREIMDKARMNIRI